MKALLFALASVAALAQVPLPSPQNGGAGGGGGGTVNTGVAGCFVYYPASTNAVSPAVSTVCRFGLNPPYLETYDSSGALTWRVNTTTGVTASFGTASADTAACLASAPSTPSAGVYALYCLTSDVYEFLDDNGNKFQPVKIGGDITNSSGAVIKVNGASLPTSAPFVSTNSSQQIVLASPFAKNAQTSTYQVLASDFSGYKTIPVASGTFTMTLVPSGSQPADGQSIRVVNYGSGVVTIARSGQNINGGTSSLTLPAGSATAPTSAWIMSDGTNYFANVSLSVGSSTVTETVNYPIISNNGGGLITSTGWTLVSGATAMDLAGVGFLGVDMPKTGTPTLQLVINLPANYVSGSLKLLLNTYNYNGATGNAIEADVAVACPARGASIAPSFNTAGSVTVNPSGNTLMEITSIPDTGCGSKDVMFVKLTRNNSPTGTNIDAGVFFGGPAIVWQHN